MTKCTICRRLSEMLDRGTVTITRSRNDKLECITDTVRIRRSSDGRQFCVMFATTLVDIRHARIDVLSHKLAGAIRKLHSQVI